MNEAKEPIAWPSLPKEGFISGRAATKADVDAGRAVFVAARGDIIIGKPVAMEIPQYAWYLEGSKKTPVLIIQAEEANGKIIVGAVEINGQFLVATLTEFELLGSSIPGRDET